MRRSQPCKSLKEEHSRQREQKVGMSLAGLSLMADWRVVDSEVQGAGNEERGKTRRGIWISLEGTGKLIEGCGQGGRYCWLLCVSVE